MENYFFGYFNCYDLVSLYSWFSYLNTVFSEVYPANYLMSNDHFVHSFSHLDEAKSFDPFVRGGLPHLSLCP